ncbi:hypothetical protein IAQ61_010863 [Plenodomus lingam]|uniref:Tudor domain-containing protein n=1 Tax=Leptosphaeria maculans (strain JN3 / isolate v23.1.3 / race Av1-4-5-6-7-8) TaxID=985895 RepID=E4ZJ87_LEPMJ|nr:hypothetical protein LEMA_P070260.1 [Plenodomus lingam JN3]KAH9861126.1 hypothetical protein IAQ61_010863 [Plenodomus lingam]CBX91518.1 hypothetical protein LEMA_P070260.1 [Plenodomus lingam JN3]
MADEIKQTKIAINQKKQAIAQEEATRNEWVKELAELEKLYEATGNKEIEAMRPEMQGYITTQDAILKTLRSELAALESQLPQAPQADGPKFDPEKHPLLRKTVEKQEPEKNHVFSTGDMCEAQWSDKSWYKAKIQSILGSVSAPKYLVRFIEYDDTLTVDRAAVRPLPSKRKREPETAQAPPLAASVTSTPHVISGPASINPNAQNGKNKATTNDADIKPASRVPNKGILKKRASAWNDFQAKASKKGITKKDSMFRTSTEAGSRVGFTGSGKGMTETHKRLRYDHKADAELDPEEHPDTIPSQPSHPRKRI